MFIFLLGKSTQIKIKINSVVFHWNETKLENSERRYMRFSPVKCDPDQRDAIEIIGIR